MLEPHDDTGGCCLGYRFQRQHDLGMSRCGLMDLLLKTWLSRQRSQICSLARPIGMAFCAYEATFISVKEPKPAPRSKSAGTNASRQPCAMTSYVASLEQRASALTFLQRSEGSAGHPELCFKPCLYLAYGACPRGAECGFCHLPHKGGKLRKTDRELLRQLGEADRLALTLPYLRGKNLG